MTKKFYKIGHILNPLHGKIGRVRIGGRACKLVVPARVNTFLCHHNFFANPLKPNIYPVNSINFAIAKFSEATVTVRSDKKIVISALDKHKALIEHVVRVMQKTLKIDMGFNIKAKNLHSISHGGLGSSSAIMSAVAGAINILLGKPLSVEQVTKLISQNYAEESPKKGFLSSAASIGGSTAIALSGKSLVVMGGESDIWYSGNLPKEYSAILLYPKKIKSITKAEDIELNKKELRWLKSIDKDWGDIKEHMLKEKIVPAINKKDYSILFKAINMYTTGNYGNIPQYFKDRWVSYGLSFDSLIFTISSKLFGPLKTDENCFFVSSNGPLVAIITKYPKRAVELLKDLKKDFYIESTELS